MNERITVESNVISSMRRSLVIEADSVRALVDKADYAALAEAVDILVAVRSIVTTASGTSGIAAAKFAHSLCCVERPARYMAPHEATSGALGGISPGDAMVVVSRGGKTAELLPIIDVAKNRGATLIAVTENRESYLAQAADLVVPMVIDRESDPLNVMATASFQVTIALFDAILAGIITATDFTAEAFGVIHPAGAVGERLRKTPEEK